MLGLPQGAGDDPARPRIAKAPGASGRRCRGARDAGGPVLRCAAVTVAARPSPLARAWSARWSLGAEIVLFLVLMFAYEWVRDLVALDDPTRLRISSHYSSRQTR